MLAIETKVPAQVKDIVVEKSEAMKDTAIEKGTQVNDTIVSTTKTTVDYTASTTKKAKLLNVYPYWVFNCTSNLP